MDRQVRRRRVSRTARCGGHLLCHDIPARGGTGPGAGRHGPEPRLPAGSNPGTRIRTSRTDRRSPVLDLRNSTRQGRGHALRAALRVDLAPALVPIGQADARSRRGTGNMQDMPGIGDGTSAKAAGTVGSINAAQGQDQAQPRANSGVRLACHADGEGCGSLGRSQQGHHGQQGETHAGSDGTCIVQSLSPAR